MSRLHLPPVSFYYLRHGETAWNAERRIQGSTDVPLNARGLAQAAAAAEIIGQLPIAAVVSSPLSRAFQTAEIAARDHQLAIETEPDLREVGFGPHEGTIAGPWFREVINGVMPEGAEPFDVFVERAVAGMRAALSRPAPVLVVAHGGVFWAIEKACGLDTTRVLGNCQPVRLDPPAAPGKAWTIVDL